MDRWDPVERAEALRQEEEKAAARRQDNSGSSSSGSSSHREAHGRRDQPDVGRREEAHRRRRSGSRERERERRRSPMRTRSRSRSHSRERIAREQDRERERLRDRDREREHGRERERERERDAPRRRSQSRSRSRSRELPRSRSRSRERARPRTRTRSPSRSRSRNRSPPRREGKEVQAPLSSSAAPAVSERSRSPRQRSQPHHSQQAHEPHSSQPQHSAPQPSQTQLQLQQVQQPPPSSHIMLRGFPHHITDDQLLAALCSHFSSCARPLSLRVIRDRDSGSSRGYAFADMGSVEQGVQLHTQAASNMAAGRPFIVEGRAVQISYGVPKSGHDAKPAQPTLPAPAPAPVVDVAWDCTRCSTHNEPYTHSCSCCNLARAVMAGGEAAIAAMSTSYRGGSHAAHLQQPQQQQHPYQQYPHIAAVLGATVETALAPFAAVPTADESLQGAIAAGQVLFLSSLPPLSTPSTVRDALVPHAAVADVKVLLDEASGAPLDRALVELDSAEECQALLLKFAAQPLRMGELSVRVTAAGAQHLSYAAPGRYISWLVESSVHAAQRLTAAVATAASQQSIFGGEGDAQKRPRGLHDMWQKVVAEQTGAYPALAAGAPPSAHPLRPVGLAPSFVWDASSGYWFDASSGYYFDAGSCLYYHGASQTYSRWEPAIGQYVVLDQHGQAPGAATDDGSHVAAQYLALKAAQAFEQQAQLAPATTNPDATASSMPALEPAPAISFSLQSSVSPLLRQPPAVSAAAAAAAATAPGATSSAAAAAAPPSFIDLSRLACLLCHRQLKSAEQLLAHEQKSELHAKNLAAWQATNPGVVPPPPTATQAKQAAPPAATRAPATAAAAKPKPPAAAPLSAAEDYKRQMAKYNVLEINQGLGQRPLMK